MTTAIGMAFALLFVTAFLVLRFGAGPERSAALTLVAWVVLDRIYHSLFGAQNFDVVDYAHLILDGAAAGLFIWIALFANRMWPIPAASAQVIAVVGHLSAIVEPSGMQRAYWAMTQLPLVVQLIALALGTIFHRRRFLRGGAYRDWRSGKGSPFFIRPITK